MSGRGDASRPAAYLRPAHSQERNDMGLTVAVQMDPMETINIAGDSTFALMLSAQARGHTLFHYAAGDLSYRDGRVYAPVRSVTVQRVAGGHFQFGDVETFDL